MDVDLFRYTQEEGTAVRKKRARRERVSAPAQTAANEKRARRYLGQLLNANFEPGTDLHITLTYSPEQLPESEKAAERRARNYLRRVASRRRKLGLSELKYILVTETGQKGRVHHHLVINGGIDRDDLELMWTAKRINWAKLEKERAAGREEHQKSIERLGFANADRLQAGENGFVALAAYLTKQKSRAGKRKWTCSQNLQKPERTTNDHKYSCRKLEKLCTSGAVWTREWWEKTYPGYTLAGTASMAVELHEPDDMSGWSVYARLRKTRIRS